MAGVHDLNAGLPIRLLAPATAGEDATAALCIGENRQAIFPTGKKEEPLTTDLRRCGALMTPQRNFQDAVREAV